MIVTHAGEGLRFWVTSADDHEPYLVDLTANDGLPACTCPDFRCRCQPLIDRDRKIRQYGYTDRTICKHAQQALLYIGCMALANYTKRNINDIYQQYETKSVKTQGSA